MFVFVGNHILLILYLPNLGDLHIYIRESVSVLL
jgi:hypothetical protein